MPYDFSLDIKDFIGEEPSTSKPTSRTTALAPGNKEKAAKAEQEKFLRELKEQIKLLKYEEKLKKNSIKLEKEQQELTKKEIKQRKSKLGEAIAGVAGGVLVANALTRIAKSSQSITKLMDMSVKLLASLIDIFLAPFMPLIVYFLLKIYDVLRAFIQPGAGETPGVEAAKKMAQLDLGGIVLTPEGLAALAGAILVGLAAALAGASVGWIAVAAIIGALLAAWLVQAAYEAGDAFMGWLRVNLFPAITEFLNTVYNAFVSFFGLIYNLGDQTWDFFYGLGASFRLWIDETLTTISSLVSAWTAPIKNALDWITTAISTFVNNIKAPFQNLIDTFEPFTSLFTGGNTSNTNTTVSNAWNITSTGVEDLEGTIINTLRQFGTKFFQ